MGKFQARKLCPCLFPQDCSLVSLWRGVWTFWEQPLSSLSLNNILYLYPSGVPRKPFQAVRVNMQQSASTHSLQRGHFRVPSLSQVAGPGARQTPLSKWSRFLKCDPPPTPLLTPGYYLGRVGSWSDRTAGREFELGSIPGTPYAQTPPCIVRS